MTYKQRLIAGLLNLGWSEDPTHSTSKLVAFKHPNQSQPRRFVGKAGALRSGRIASQSISIGDPGNQTRVYTAILKAAQV